MARPITGAGRWPAGPLRGPSASRPQGRAVRVIPRRGEREPGHRRAAPGDAETRVGRGQAGPGRLRSGKDWVAGRWAGGVSGGNDMTEAEWLDASDLQRIRPFLFDR